MMNPASFFRITPWLVNGFNTHINGDRTSDITRSGAR